MLKKITVEEKNAKGRVMRRRHRYIQTSHGFVETTQGGDRGYGDASPRGQGYQMERTTAAPSAASANTADLERQNTRLREREADLLKRIETLERRMDDLTARVGGLEERPAQEMPKSVSGEMTVLRDRLAHLTNKHGAEILELQKALAVLGNAAAAHMQQG